MIKIYISLQISSYTQYRQYLNLLIAQNLTWNLYIYIYQIFQNRNIMQAYTNMVKTLYSTGQQYLFGGSDRKKQPIVKIDKAATIYQAKCFNDSKIDPKKCISILAKLIYLFNQGQQFAEAETTTLFFSITKLLQVDDPFLRRVVYLLIKQLRDQPSIYIVTSSLLKDIHHKDCNYRRNALRTLPLVLDQSNLVQVQRYIKSLMNDSDTGVICSALLAGLQIHANNQDIVKKWVAQVLDKLPSKDQYVQYHALTLIGQIKKNDVKFMKKSLEGMMTNNNPVGLAALQHLRMLNLTVRDCQYQSKQVKDFVAYVLKQVRNVDDAVVIQAAKIACQSIFFSNKDLLEVVKVLERFLVSDSTTKKYTVLKLYNSLLKNSSRKSLIVNVTQIQKVLKDKNVNLSSTAASILLRICSQNYLQKLLHQLCRTMSQMSTDYKIDVIRSLQNVLRSYPKQFQIINQFLVVILIRQKTEEIRRQSLQVLAYEITDIGGAAKKQCLSIMAKYLSEAKYQKLHFQILGLISRQVKTQDVTSELLKSLMLEIYLQEGSIKACGLSTLIKISEVHQQKKKVLERTISKFQKDKDQEVRERILFKPQQKPLNSFQLDMIENYLFYNCQKIQSSNDTSLLSFGSIKKWGEQAGPSLMKKQKKSAKKAEQKAKQYQQQQKHYKQLFINHSAFKQYGPLRKINERKQISDSQGELSVSARLFLFDKNLVIEYEIENRFQSAVLENVKVEVKHSGEQFLTQHVIAAKVIANKNKCSSYVGLSKSQESQQMMPEESIGSIVKYIVKQYSGDKLKNSYDDEFSLQNFDIKLSTYMSHWMMESSDYDKQWQTLKGEEQSGTFQLNYASKQAAIQQIIKKYGLTPIINQQIKNSNKINLYLAGKFMGSYRTLMKTVIGFDTKLGCIVKVSAKSEKMGLSDQLVNALE